MDETVHAENGQESNLDPQNVKKLLSDIANLPKDEIDIDLLIDYVFSQTEQNEQASNAEKISEGDQYFVEQMIATDTQWKAAYEEISNMYQRLQNSLQEKGILSSEILSKDKPHLSNKKQYVGKADYYKPLLNFLDQKSVRVVFVSLAVLITLYSCLYFISNAKEKEYYSLALRSSFIIPMRSSGNDEDYIVEIKQAYAHSDYAKVVELGEKSLTKSLSVNEIIILDQILATGYMQNSRRSFLGLFPYFESRAVRKSIQHCQDALKRIPHTNLSDVEKKYNREKTLLIIAKAYLLLDDLNTSKKYLNEVINMNGYYLSEAHHINYVLNSSQ